MQSFFQPLYLGLSWNIIGYSTLVQKEGKKNTPYMINSLGYVEAIFILMKTQNVWKQGRHAVSYHQGLCLKFQFNSYSHNSDSPYFNYEFTSTPLPSSSLSALECPFLVLSPSILIESGQMKQSFIHWGGEFLVMKLSERLSIFPPLSDFSADRLNQRCWLLCEWQL